MRNLIKLSFYIALSFLFFLTACNSSSSDSKNNNKFLPVLNEQTSSRHGCLSTEAIQNMFSNTGNSFPALEVTTNFNPDSSLGSDKSLYAIHSAFDIRNISTGQMAFFQQPTQGDCSTVLSKSASGEVLHYRITRSTPNSLSLEFQRAENSELVRYRKEGLENRLQPLKYEIEIMDQFHLRVKTTYKGFDIHCRTKKTPTSTIQRDYFWSQDSAGLPSQVSISRNFYNAYLSTLKPDTVPDPILEPQPFPQPQPPPEEPIVPEPPSIVTFSQNQADYLLVNVSEIKDMLSKEIREDIARCSN